MLPPRFSLAAFTLTLLVVVARAWESSSSSPRPPATSRRGWLLAQARRATTVSVIAASSYAFAADPAQARDDDRLFRNNNLLTNPLLEQIRMFDQAQANEIKYGGELERGDAGSRGKVEAYPGLLVPILGIAQDLTAVEQLVLSSTTNEETTTATATTTSAQRRQAWRQARQILASPVFDKIAFKRTFNRYGDNIYYSDPDRANLYLGGGATPKTEQSLAYLLRNEILTTVEDLQAELDYLIQSTGNDESAEDLQSLVRTVQSAMKRYLDVVPPRELQRAKELFVQQQQA